MEALAPIEFLVEVAGDELDAGQIEELTHRLLSELRELPIETRIAAT